METIYKNVSSYLANRKSMIKITEDQIKEATEILSLFQTPYFHKVREELKARVMNEGLKVNGDQAILEANSKRKAWIEILESWDKKERWAKDILNRKVL